MGGEWMGIAKCAMWPVAYLGFQENCFVGQQRLRGWESLAKLN